MIYVCVDSQARASTPLPDAWKQAVLDYEPVAVEQAS